MLTAAIAMFHTVTPGFAQPAVDADQEREPERVVTLSPFVVEDIKGYAAQQTLIGTRSASNLLEIPTSVSVITHEVLSDINAMSVHEALAVGVSGVTRNQTMTDDVNIRGFRTASSLRNGISKLTNKRNPMYDIDRVEVIKGPGAMLLGNNRFLGGAVNLISRQGTDAPAGYFQATFSDDNFFRAMTNVSGPLVRDTGDGHSSNYRVTLGGTTGRYPKAVEWESDRFYGAGATLRFWDGRIIVNLSGYYFLDESNRNWNDFIDLDSTDTRNGLTVAKLNQYSTKNFSPGRKQDTWTMNIDRFVDASIVAQLTDRANLRLYYAFSSVMDRRMMISGSGVQPDNYTLSRTGYALANDRPTHNFQMDFLHELPLGWVTIESTFGADGAWEVLKDTGLGSVPLPDLDTRQPDYAMDEAYFSAANPELNRSRHQITTGSYTRTGSGYFQENLSFLDKRVILVGGLRWITTGGENLNYVTREMTKKRNDTYRVHKYGMVVKLLPSVSAYYTNAENINIQTGFNDRFADNDRLGGPQGNRRGQLDEFGLKFNHSFSRDFQVYGSVVHFDMAQTNIPTRGLLETGVIGNVTSERDQIAGWEVDAGLKLRLGSHGHTDLIFTYFDGRGKTAVDPTLAPDNFVPRKYSVLGKYTWTSGPLTGLMLGGSLMDQSAKRNAVSYSVDYPLVVNLFAGYKWGEQWSAQLNVNNVTDKRYIVAMSTPGAVVTDPGLKTFLSIKYGW